MLTPYEQNQLSSLRQLSASMLSGTNTSTVVPVLKDYTNDPQLCLTTVVFVDPAIYRHIYEKLIEPLKAIKPSFYYYPHASLHITVQNIRVIHDPPRFTQPDIQKAFSVCRAIIPTYQSLSLRLYGAIQFATSAVIGVLHENTFDDLVLTLRKAFAAAGVPDDKNYFNATILSSTTFCRFAHEPSQEFIRSLEAFREYDFGSMKAMKIYLVETNSVAHPQKTKVHGEFVLSPN